ncbi:DUF366 family protein [bacterium]|nr:DUF366 family protein [bacterium]
MNTFFIDQETKYHGYELSPHWIYRNFNLKGDSIVAFVGECEVKLSEMVDIEDVINNEPIYSDKMLSFVEENFHSTLQEAIFRQRLLAGLVRDMILECFPDVKVRRDGDDVYLNDKKLTVSIATKTITSTLIHFGINVTPTHAPVAAAGLKSDLNIDDIKGFALELMKRYTDEISDIDFSASKVRGVSEK